MKIVLLRVGTAYAFLRTAVIAEGEAMEARRDSQSGRRRFKVLRARRRGRKQRTASAIQAGIVCQYGVIVQCISTVGLELIQFEFLPDVA